MVCVYFNYIDSVILVHFAYFVGYTFNVAKAVGKYDSRHVENSLHGKDFQSRIRNHQEFTEDSSMRHYGIQ